MEHTIHVRIWEISKELWLGLIDLGIVDIFLSPEILYLFLDFNQPIPSNKGFLDIIGCLFTH